MTGGWRRWRRPAIDIGLIAVFLLGLSFLPPDTSLADRRAQGVLRFCVPDLSSPLVSAGGRELRLMQGIAEDLGLRLQLVEIANMGRSFNPRDWQLGRGQCDIIGGGLADSATNRDFLTLLPNDGRIGLVRVGPAGNLTKNALIAVHLGSAGFDRLRLSGWIRAQGWRATPLSDPRQLDIWLRDGGVAITSSLTPLPAGIAVLDLPPDAVDAHDLAFGLWRGDVTLTRAFRLALQRRLSATRSQSQNQTVPAI